MIEAPAEAVWRALTARGAVANWFGDLDAPLENGSIARVEFGDGDFFTLEDIRLNPPHSVQYSWRFLGVGPRDNIRWTVASAGNCCAVTATDEEEGRSPEEARQLRKGWLDFTRRLRDYLHKGESTRYSWRHDFDGSIELPCDVARAREKLFSPEAQARWLPLPAGASLSDGTYFYPTDGEEPSRLLVTRVEWKSRYAVAFRLSTPVWQRPTMCQLNLSSRPHGTLLSVSHRGWRLIGADVDYQKEQRRRFCHLWVGLLTEARQLVASPASL